MEQVQYWVIWYPSYIHKNFELIGNQPIIEKLTDDDYYHLNVHTYLKIETYPSEEQEKANVCLCFYNKENNRKTLLKKFFSVFCDNIKEDLFESNPVATIHLKYINHSSDGLFVYECSADENSKKFVSNTGKSLLSDHKQYSTFYAIKQLYHTHLFHKKSKYNKQYKDYFYRAYIDTTKIDVEKINNEAIIFYLKKIQKHFQEQLEHFEIIKTSTADIKTKKKLIKKDIEKLQKQIDDYTEDIEKLQKQIANSNDEKESLLLSKAKTIKEDLIELWKKVIIKRKTLKELYIEIGIKKKDRDNLYKTINNIVGETLFTNILCCSKYLDKGLDNLDKEKTEEDKEKIEEVRKLILNIENLKMGLYYIRDCYKYVEDKKVSMLGISIGKLGYFVGVLGILFTLSTSWMANKLSQKQQEKIEELSQKRDSLLINTISNSLKKDTVYIEITSSQLTKK